ncbi:MAG: hypothetical protein HY420_02075 [Candidatus Kerfeldbacteria bacterium]|nr:hypothetical protein [Candidatus Kerfeldbacteria bacterium]
MEMERDRTEFFSKIAEEAELKGSVKKYIDLYLPPSEDRIPEKMSDSCQVALVIPAYGERKYILRPLGSLAEQVGTSPDEFEVIIVINNPPSAPIKLENEHDAIYKARLQHYETALADNQETLNLLSGIKTLSEEEISAGLSTTEIEEIHRIKESGLIFHVIDKASEGKTLSSEQANVGGARNRGVAEAVARFAEIDRNGIIAQSDADIRFEPDYVASLIKQYQNHPDIIGFRGAVELESEVDSGTISESTKETTRMKRLYKRLLNRYKDIQGIGYQGKINQAQDDSGESIPVFWGSNMSSRAFEAAKVGGVPMMGAGEDPAFGKRLAAIGKIGYAPDIRVAQLSRVSARAEGGHGIGILKANRRLERGLSIEVENPLVIPHINSLIEIIKERLSSTKDSAQASVIEAVQEFFGSHNIAFREKRLAELDDYLTSGNLITDEGIQDLLRKATKITLGQAIKYILEIPEIQAKFQAGIEYKDLVKAFQDIEGDV